MYIRTYAGFEAENEVDYSSIGNKTTNISEQNPVLNGYRIEPGLEDVLKRGFYESLLGYDNIDWYVNEVKKLKNKKGFLF